MTLPLTVRLMYHGFRAAITGAVILVIGWIAFIPATTAEASALGQTPRTDYPAGLRQMRAAKVFVTIAPDPAYDLAARAMGPEVTGWMLRLVVAQVAAGNLPRPPPETAPAPSDRDIDGPRFLQVD